jgi:transposase
MFVRTKGTGGYKYLQIVENYRQDSKIKQRVLLTLGRKEQLVRSGKLDNLARSLLRFSEKLRVVEAHRDGGLKARSAVSIGPALIFGRLWKELEIDQIIEGLLEGRKYRFSLERAIFLTVLHRLFDPGSDRAAERWREDFRIEGTEGIELHHLYRAMEWLGEELPEAEQYGATPFSPRCTKDKIEERLFERNRDLFSSLDLVFFDTTSLSFEGEGGESIGQYGFSKNHRPDLKQMVVGAVLDEKGRPICCELWPGNTADMKTLLPVVDRLRGRFHLSSICVVADRGMISAETIAELESGQRGVEYILGVRMRKQKEVREEIVKDQGGYEKVEIGSSKKKGPRVLEVKEVVIEGRRYIITYNPEQAKKDAADRAAIVESLRERMKQGEKALIGNKGYRKYVRSSGTNFTIDEEKIKEEAFFDGKWVLRTNSRLTAAEVALKYKELWMVEHIFRSVKSILETQPIYHRCDETIRGHVFCSFLALVVMKELQVRMEAKGFTHEWEEIRRDLEALEEVEVEKDSEIFYLRTDLRGVCHDIFRACGVAIPPSVRQ